MLDYVRALFLANDVEDETRKFFLGKIFKNYVIVKPHTPENLQNLLTVFQENILSNPKDLFVQLAHEFFVELAQKNIPSLRGVLEPKYLEEICVNPKHIHKHEIPRHLASIATLIKDDSDLLGIDMDERILVTIQGQTARLYVEHGDMPDVSKNLLDLYRMHPYLLPTGIPYLVIVRHVIFQLISMKNNHKTHEAIVAQATRLSNFMLSLWELSPDPESSLAIFLEQFFTDIPNPEQKLMTWLSEIERKDAQVAHKTILSKARDLVKQRHTASRRVGLSNLGNTCYINSVLQALFINDEFYSNVMSAPLNSKDDDVLHQLQKTFAFMKLSKRKSYSPESFIKVSKPPWFETGYQQDCSEFLRYLLNSLQKTDDECRHPIENISLQSRVVETAMEVGKSDATEATFKSAVMPENNSDDDMEVDSEGSCEQVDLFDGQGCFEPCPSVGPDTVHDSDDATSIGSRSTTNSLKRWTTEENLSSDSGIHSVKDSIRGSNDSMTNEVPSNLQELTSSLITFTNMESEPSSCVEKAGSPRILITEASDANPVGTETQKRLKTEESPQTIEEKVFGGKIQVAYQCDKCSTISVNIESFNDLLLSFPSDISTSDISMQDLIQRYLEPERFHGENKYHCKNCGGLEEAHKTVDIIEPPQHLKCILMRFNYDREKGCRHKILTDVNYELEINIPVGKSGEPKKEVLYSLYAIVVHSGLSADHGHYFTYARPPKQFTEKDSNKTFQEIRNDYNKEAGWFIFNDTVVSPTDFDSFSRLKQRSNNDSAYVLFYQRFDSWSYNHNNDRNSVPIRSDLKRLVDQDNAKFLEEQKQTTLQLPLSKFPPRKKDDDPDEDDLDQFSHGCNTGNDFSAPGRYVC